jgi:hypothetical protein
MEHGLSVSDRGDGNAEQRRELEHLGRRLLRQPRVLDLVPLGEAQEAARELRERLVLLEIGTLDHDQEVRELLPRVGAEADVAVGGRLDRRGLDRRCQEGMDGIRGASVHQPVHRLREVGE